MAPETEVKNPALDINDEYKYGFSDPEKPVFKAEKGINHDVVEQISQMKSEPEWMREFRHDALDVFESKPMPNWGNTGLLNDIDFDNIYYYLKPVEKQGSTWDEVPEDIKNTFDRLGYLVPGAALFLGELMQCVQNNALCF